MSNENKIKFETLSQKAKKKKDFIIVGLILLILSFLFISISLAFIGNDDKKTFEKKVDNKIEDNSFNVVKKSDIKETWAMATENKIEKIKDEIGAFKSEIKEDNKNNLENIKNIILEATANQNKKIEEQNQTTTNTILEMKNNIELKLNEQQNEIEDMKLRNGSSSISQPNENSDEDIVLGTDLLPELDKKTFIEKSKKDEKIVKEEKLNKPSTPEELKKDELASSPESQEKEIEKKVVKIVDLDTSSTVDSIDKEEKLMAELKELKLKQDDNFHLMTGLSQAYMITGAYAPAFDSGEEEPLPVLLQAEGDILIANDDSQTIDKCMLIGTAKGNMNSQTADIRLVKISCSLAEGTKKLEGDISGWVIGENGIPGVQGELLHKNGAWLSRTFLAGFLETFSSSLGKTDQTAITIGTTGTSTSTVPISTAMSDNAKQAAAGGLSTVFGKIGEYYLKMAEQIFPVIEVKGGRTVNILLKGGEDFQVSDFKKLDLTQINEKIDEYNKQKENLSPTEYIKLKKQEEEEQDNSVSKTKDNLLKKPKIQEQNSGLDMSLNKLEGKNKN